MTNKALIVGLAERTLRSVLVLVLAGLLGAALVRLAPGRPTGGYGSEQPQTKPS